jgi:alkylation response protein AidB-like acyl-CoA dehydrogenase
MDLLPNDEQQEIIDQSAAFLGDTLPVRRLQELESAGEQLTRDTWQTIADLGWFGLGLTEDQGGVGFTLAEETLLVREIGRSAGPPALLATLLAARVAALGGADDARDALVGGSARAAFAENLSGGATLGNSISGEFHLFDPEGADYFVAVGSDGAALISASVASGATPSQCVDDSVAMSVVELDSVPALAFVSSSDDDIYTRSTVLTAAMLVGIAEAVRDDAVSYATERVQFGKPIGVFQAIKHPCADMAVRCEAALSQTLMASLHTRDGLPDAPLQAASAKVVASSAAMRGSMANVQIHGGYGFTTEYDAQRFVKRTHVVDVLGGSGRSRLADVLAAPTPT